MYPYLKMDHNISEEFAQELLDCLWVKFNGLSKIRDEVSAQAFAGYGGFQNLIVGGQTGDGLDATNDVSYMCMVAAAHVQLPQPSFSIRVHQNTPEEFLYRACEVVRLGTGVPAMYNDETIIPALCNRGVSLADARNYGMIGCVEPQSPHKTDGWHDSAFVNVAKILELTLNGGKNNGHQVGPDTGDVTSFKSIEDVWRAFEKQIQYFVHHVVEACNSVDYAHTERTPLPFLSGLVDDCIGKGLSLQHGGAVYNFTGPQAFGVADCGDSIYAMQTHVFENKELTMAQLKDALDHNFGCGCCETASDDEARIYEAVNGFSAVTVPLTYQPFSHSFLHRRPRMQGTGNTRGSNALWRTPHGTEMMWMMWICLPDDVARSTHVKWKNIKTQEAEYTRQDAILYRLMYCLERMLELCLTDVLQNSRWRTVYRQDRARTQTVRLRQLCRLQSWIMRTTPMVHCITRSSFHLPWQAMKVSSVFQQWCVPTLTIKVCIFSSM